MVRLSLLALLWLGTLQSTPESLIEDLSSTDIQRRTKAARELLELGKAAVPALTRAAHQPDPDVALHAKELLARIEFRSQMTPALLALDGLESRLFNSGSRAWTAFFLEAVPWKAPPTSPYSRLEPSDLACLAEKAIEGAKDESELTQVLEVVLHYRLERCQGALETLVQDPRPSLRGLSSKALVLCERKDVLARAKGLLNSGDRIVGDNAIAALGERKVKSAVPMLLALKDDSEHSYEVGKSLLELGSKEGAQLLLQLMDRSEKVSGAGVSQATMYLSFYAGPEIIPQMRSRLRFIKNDPNTADGALTYLGNWGDQGAIPMIEQAVRDFRIWGNNSTNIPRALYFMGARSSSATLVKLMQDRHSYAMTVIGLMGLRDAVPSLRESLARGESQAAVQLAELGDRESLPAIRKLLENPDVDVRRNATSALAMLEDTESLGILRAVPEAPSLSLIWPAIGRAPEIDDAALPLIGTPPGVSWSGEYSAALVEGTNSTYGFPRYLSVRAAASVRGGRTPEQLLPWLGKTGNDYPGLIASAALARLGRKEGIPDLLEADHLLMSLNAARNPETWRRLESKTTMLNTYAPYQEVHQALAKEAGLELEGPPKDSDAYIAWSHVHQRFHKWGRPPTITEAFEMMDESRWSIVLEKDKIRVVPHDQAVILWTEWATRVGALNMRVPTDNR